jgi:hypothetical protein
MNMYFLHSSINAPFKESFMENLDFNMTAFSEDGQAVTLTIILSVEHDEALVFDWFHGRQANTELYSYSIQSIYNANINGAPYSITEDDQEAWQSEINYEAERFFERYMDGQRAIKSEAV